MGALGMVMKYPIFCCSLTSSVCIRLGMFGLNANPFEIILVYGVAYGVWRF